MTVHPTFHVSCLKPMLTSVLVPAEAPAEELGEMCNRDSPSNRFYFVTANSLVRLALSAPAYYMGDFVLSESLVGELAPVCVVLPLLVVFPRLWVYLENPIPRNSKSHLVLRPIPPPGHTNHFSLRNSPAHCTCLCFCLCHSVGVFLLSFAP